MPHSGIVISSVLQYVLLEMGVADGATVEVAVPPPLTKAALQGGAHSGKKVLATILLA